ncbi:hypothetical protein Brsp07_03629 [Brucella sp. NBRC 14130]
MCGRFSELYTWSEIHAMYNLVPATPRNLQPRYNVAPTTDIGVNGLQNLDRTCSSLLTTICCKHGKCHRTSIRAAIKATIRLFRSRPIYWTDFETITRCSICAIATFIAAFRLSVGQFDINRICSSPSVFLSKTINAKPACGNKFSSTLANACIFSAYAAAVFVLSISCSFSGRFIANHPKSNRRFSTFKATLCIKINRLCRLQKIA